MRASRAQEAASQAYAGRGLLSGSRTDQRPAQVTTMVLTSPFARSPEEVFRFSLARDTFPALMPDPVTVLWTSTQDGELGGTYDFRWRFKRVVPIRWTAFIDSWDEGREFSDRQVRGMFRWFHHTHTCDPDPAGCRYTDTVTFRSLLGPRLDRAVLLPQMESLFRTRHDRMRRMLDAMP